MNQQNSKVKNQITNADYKNLVVTNNEDKVTILLKVLDDYRNEMLHHRTTQFKTFSWASSVLLAILTAIAVLKSYSQDIRIFGTLTFTISSVAITWLSIRLLQRSAKLLEGNARKIVDLEKRLGLFEADFFGVGKAVYGEIAKKWGSKLPASTETGFYIKTLLVLAFLVIIVACLQQIIVFLSN